MLTTQFRCPRVLLVFSALAMLTFSVQTRLCAAEPEYATVALLLPSGGGVPFPEGCVEDPVGVLFDSPFEPSGSPPVTLSASFPEGLRNRSLFPMDAAYVSSGGLRQVVWGFDAFPPEHGWMRLGPNSDTTVHYCDFVTKSGSTLTPETDPPSSEYLLVIVTGSVQ